MSRKGNAIAAGEFGDAPDVAMVVLAYQDQGAELRLELISATCREHLEPSLRLHRNEPVAVHRWPSLVPLHHSMVRDQFVRRLGCAEFFGYKPDSRPISRRSGQLALPAGWNRLDDRSGSHSRILLRQGRQTDQYNLLERAAADGVAPKTLGVGSSKRGLRYGDDYEGLRPARLFPWQCTDRAYVMAPGRIVYEIGTGAWEAFL